MRSPSTRPQDVQVTDVNSLSGGSKHSSGSFAYTISARGIRRNSDGARAVGDRQEVSGLSKEDEQAATPFWKVMLRESAVAVWLILLLIVIIAVQFIVMGEVRKASIASQSDLISTDIRRAVNTFFMEKLAVIRNHEWLLSTGQAILGDNMIVHPRYAEVNNVTNLPNPREVQEFEATTAGFFAQDPDLVAIYMAMSNLQTWKMHRETVPYLSTQFRFAGNISGAEYFERYDRLRFFNQTLSNFTLGKFKNTRYIPTEQGWYQAASAAPMQADGQPEGVWSGPEFQGRGAGAATAADEYPMDPVMVFSKKVYWKQAGLHSVFKLKMLTKRVNLMLQGLDVPRGGDVLVVNADGLIAATRSSVAQVIPDPTDPTNAKKATVAHMSTLGTFSIINPSDLLHNGTLRYKNGVTLYSLDAVIPGWRIAIYLDGDVLVEPFRPYLNALLTICILLIILSLVSIAYSANNVRRQVKLSGEKAFADLLVNLLPAEVAQRCITKAEWPICDHFPEATVFFADMVGFTRRSSTMEPQDIVMMLNALVENFDDITFEHRVEKVKTIGDCYMAVTGVPTRSRTHAIDMVRFAVEFQNQVRLFNENDNMDMPVFFRVGINSGEVTMGIIGSRRFAFDIFGDTVNVASRMESNSEAARIRVSQSTFVRTNELVTYGEPEDLLLKGKEEPIKAYFVQALVQVE